MDRIVALVITYNREKLLKECIQGLLSQNYVCDILIIDNASTDGTRGLVESYLKEYSNLDYINTGANLGGAGGFAFGIKECVKRGYDYIWMMDDDTIPYSDSLANLVEADRQLKGDYGFLCSIVEWIDGSLCKMNKPLIADDWWDNGKHLYQGYIPVKKGSFVSFFVKCDVVKRVGLPIKEFFIWYDDSEYSRRIVENEGAGYLISNSRVLHKMNSNTSVDIITESSERLSRYRYAFRNRCYMQKHRGILIEFKYAFFIFRTVLNIIKYSKNKKRERIRIVLSGTFDGIRFNPEIETVDF